MDKFKESILILKQQYLKLQLRLAECERYNTDTEEMHINFNERIDNFKKAIEVLENNNGNK